MFYRSNAKSYRKLKLFLWFSLVNGSQVLTHDPLTHCQLWRLVQERVGWCTGAVHGGGGAAALLLPGRVLPDARRRHSAVHLRVRRVSCSSQARHGSHDLRRLV